MSNKFQLKAKSNSQKPKAESHKAIKQDEKKTIIFKVSRHLPVKSLYLL